MQEYPEEAAALQDRAQSERDASRDNSLRRLLKAKSLHVPMHFVESSASDDDPSPVEAFGPVGPESATGSMRRRQSLDSLLALGSAATWVLGEPESSEVCQSEWRASDAGDTLGPLPGRPHTGLMSPSSARSGSSSCRRLRAGAQSRAVDGVAAADLEAAESQIDDMLASLTTLLQKT